MSADDICKCRPKLVHSIEESDGLGTFAHEIFFNHAVIPRITVSKCRTGNFYGDDPIDRFYRAVLPFCSRQRRANRAKKSSDDDSSKKTMELKDIEYISYRLPGNKSFRAICDYTAQDTEEVSFSKGDLIINCRSIDKDWMTGVVIKTGMFGMFPANSVQSFIVNL